MDVDLTSLHSLTGTTAAAAAAEDDVGSANTTFSLASCTYIHKWKFKQWRHESTGGPWTY